MTDIRISLQKLPQHWRDHRKEERLTLCFTDRAVIVTGAAGRKRGRRNGIIGQEGRERISRTDKKEGESSSRRAGDSLREAERCLIPSEETVLCEIVFPPAFCSYNFYQHPAELAGWLRPHLEDAGIILKRFRFVLDAGQVYLQSLRLPAMPKEEQGNWLRWEAARFVPFPAGVFTARLAAGDMEQAASAPEICFAEREENGGIKDPCSYRSKEGDPEEAVSFGMLRLSETYSEKGTDRGKAGAGKYGQNYLLAAILRERVGVLRHMAGLLQGNLCQITAAAPQGILEDIDFLSGEDTLRELTGRLYRGAAILLLAISCFVTAGSLIRWQLTKSDLAEAQDRLLPLSAIREEYRQQQETEALCRKYESFADTVDKKAVNWPLMLTVLGKSMPSGCWLEQILQKKGPCRGLELRGRALRLADLLQLKDALSQMGLFRKITLTESGSSGRTEAPGMDLGTEPEAAPVIRFVLQAEEADR